MIHPQREEELLMNKNLPVIRCWNYTLYILGGSTVLPNEFAVEDPPNAAGVT